MDRDDYLILQEEKRIQAIQERIDSMPTVGYCAHCGDPIKQSTSDLVGDEYVQIDDYLFHFDDCWWNYGNENKKTD